MESEKRPRSWAMGAVWAMLALGACAVLYVLFAAASKPEGGAYARFATGALSKLETLETPPVQPPQALADANGQPARLADFRGQVLVLNLWATWCAPCVTEMPTLAAVQGAYREQGLKVVAVSIDADADAAKAKRMLAQLSGGTLSYYRDPSRAIAFALRAGGLPTTILYDRRGNEIARLAGGADWSGPEAAALIEAALAAP